MLCAAILVGGGASPIACWRAHIVGICSLGAMIAAALGHGRDPRAGRRRLRHRPRVQQEHPRSIEGLQRFFLTETVRALG